MFFKSDTNNQVYFAVLSMKHSNYTKLRTKPVECNLWKMFKKLSQIWFILGTIYLCPKTSKLSKQLKMNTLKLF